MIDRDVLALERVDRRRDTAFELVVIVAVEDVVFAVVLVLDDGLSRLQPRLKARSVPCARFFAVGVGGPFQIGLAEVRAALPEAFVDHGLKACAVGPRFRAIDPRSGGGFGGILCLCLIERLYRTGGAVDEVDEAWECVAEEA